MSDTAKFVISLVTTVGVFMTGLGVVGAKQLAEIEAARYLAVLTVVLAAAAVIAAFLPLIARTTEVNPENLVAVKAWYKQQFNRCRAVSVAGVLLVLSMLCASGAAVAAFTLATPLAPGFVLASSGAGPGRQLHIAVSALADQDAPVDVIVRATTKSGQTQTLYVATVSPHIVDSSTADIPIGIRYVRVTLTATTSNRRLYSAELDLPS